MEVVLGLLLFWVLLACAVGLFARRYRRSGFGWFLLSLIMSPPMAFACLLGLGHADRQPIPGLVVGAVLIGITAAIIGALYKRGYIKLSQPELHWQREGVAVTYVRE